jgi:hypothetical protein
VDHREGLIPATAIHVLTGPRQLGKTTTSGNASGQIRFRTRYPVAKALLVSTQMIPLAEFISDPAGAWLV